MPTYIWTCRQGHDWDVVTTIAQRDEPSHCPDCQEEGTRGITMAQVSPTAGDWNRVEYNPGLGQWTKSWKHGREIAKAKGLEEVGNEKPGTILQRDDKRRAEKREARWADDREMVYDSSK
tara:strand:- start:7409 stop:7768 length:360 start_codon:yes stop_codon:yes gene_type:complete